MKVFLAGEGPGELGRWFNDPSYRDDVTDIGALEALLRRIRAEGWQVEGARQWKRITKYRRGRELHAAELLNVLGVALEASEAGCQVLAFMRDRDGDRERERDIEDGLARATEKFPDLQIIGGVAIEELEAWVLAMLGARSSESGRAPRRHDSPREDRPHRPDRARALVAGRELSASLAGTRPRGHEPHHALNTDTFVATGPADLPMFVCARDGVYAINRIRTTGPSPPASPRSR